MKVDVQDTTDLQKCLDHLKVCRASPFHTTYVYGSLSGRVDHAFSILNALVSHADDDDDDDDDDDATDAPSASLSSASHHPVPTVARSSLVLIDEGNMTFLLKPTGGSDDRDCRDDDEDEDPFRYCCHEIRPPRGSLRATSERQRRCSSPAASKPTEDDTLPAPPAPAIHPTLHCGVMPLVSPSPLVSTLGLKWDLLRQTVGFGKSPYVCSTSNEIVEGTDGTYCVKVRNPSVAVLWTTEIW